MSDPPRYIPEVTGSDLENVVEPPGLNMMKRIRYEHKRRTGGGGAGGQVSPPPTLRLRGQRPPPNLGQRQAVYIYYLHNGIFAHLGAIVKIFARLWRAVHTFTTALAIKLNSL